MEAANARRVEQAPLNILVAPSGYKECLEADRVAAGASQGYPSSRVVGDGGQNPDAVTPQPKSRINPSRNARS